jgi:Uma2 family endonuclease
MAVPVPKSAEADGAHSAAGRGKVSPMSAVPHRFWSLAEFLDWEERQPGKYEFDGFRPIAMTGGTLAHGYIQRNIATALDTRLRGKPCRFVGSNVKIEVAGRIRYPDGFVICTPQPQSATVARDPVVIFEVLSASTASIDSVTKNNEYAATPSVQRYVMLAQDLIGGTMFERIGADWIGRVLTADMTLKMPEIDLEVPLSEFYVGLEFPPEADEI